MAPRVLFSLLLTSLEDAAKSVLRIGSAHNKRTREYKYYPNFTSFEVFLDTLV